MCLYLFLVVRHLLETKTAVWWIDNFSKRYAVAMQGVASGAFSGCNWTGKAFKVYVGPPVHTTIARHHPLQAMPMTLFTTVLKRQVLRAAKPFAQEGWRYLKSSLVKKYKVNNVPLKPVVDMKDDPSLHKILSESRDGLSKFEPVDILAHDVGSNRGLLLILKDMMQARKASDTKYTFLCADCNIFMRIIKVHIF